MRGSKFVKFMSILKRQVSSSSIFVSFFIVMTHNSSVDFKLILFLWIKGSHQNPNFETFNCSAENFLYSSYHFPNHKSVFLQFLHHPWVSWNIAPLYFFRSNIKYFAHFFIVIILNIFVQSYCCKLFVIILFYLIPQVMHSVFGVLPCAHVTCIHTFS